MVERGFSIHRAVKSRLRTQLRITTLDSLLRMMLVSPRHIATWQTHLGALSCTILGVTGTRATAGITGVCQPLLRDLWKNTAPGDLVLPDIDDLSTECDMVDDEAEFGSSGGQITPVPVVEDDSDAEGEVMDSEDEAAGI